MPMFYQPLIIHDLLYRVHVGQDTIEYQHWHSEMELLICLSGHLWVDVEDRRYRLQPGDALILPGYVAHSTRTEGDSPCRIALNFGYALLKSGYRDVQNIGLYIPAESADVPAQLREPINALAAIYGEDRLHGSARRWRVRANLLLLCTYLLESVPPETPAKNLQDRIRRLERIYSVLDFVAANYPRKITVAEMASLSGYSGTHFCKLFKKTIGISFYRYLTCYRISIACMLLAEPRNKMSTMAQLTGFSSQPLFCRAFREVTGMTPTQFLALPPEERTYLWIQ